MNHSEKVSVAGSGMKNRYKTIIPSELFFVEVSIFLNNYLIIERDFVIIYLSFFLDSRQWCNMEH